jgi:hypothetical protein
VTNGDPPDPSARSLSHRRATKGPIQLLKLQLLLEEARNAECWDESRRQLHSIRRFYKCGWGSQLAKQQPREHRGRGVRRFTGSHRFRRKVRHFPGPRNGRASTSEPVDVGRLSRANDRTSDGALCSAHREQYRRLYILYHAASRSGPIDTDVGSHRGSTCLVRKRNRDLRRRHNRYHVSSRRRQCAKLGAGCFRRLRTR